MNARAWRVGHRSAPCDFTPRHLYAWNHRFDDPKREYRTVYCADKKRTCLREVLADFRLDTTAIREFEVLFGPDEDLREAVGKVPSGWRKEHVLTEARVVLASGTLADVESPETRERLETELRAEGLPRLNVKELRGKKRRLTQRISRALYDAGNAGVRFHSHLDGLPCSALFEHRANLEQKGSAASLADDLPELADVCKEFSLRLG